MGHLGLKTTAQPSRCDAEPQMNEAERVAAKNLPEDRSARCRKLRLR
jgi:hypothetical protein